MKFPHYKQYDEMDCGPTCIKVISKFYGRKIPLYYIKKIASNSRQGTSLLNLSLALEKIGFETHGAKLSYVDLTKVFSKPAIILWNQKHFVVLYKINNSTVYISDPGYGLIKYKTDEFARGWSNGEEGGIVLFATPRPSFFSGESLKEIPSYCKQHDLKFIYKYLLRYKNLILQISLGLLVGSCIQLLLPFITQYIVDVGIKGKNLPFIYLMLLCQMLLFLGKIGVEFVRSYTLIHLSNRINISLLSDFFIKLMKLPLSFFDTKQVGDILQRIQDHTRIETFLTSGSLNIIFSLINLVTFGFILLLYNLTIFLVFIAGSVLYFFWIYLFMKKNAVLDYKRFNQLSQNNEKNLELIYGMQEIKLNNASTIKRWQWESLQAKTFYLNLRSLALKQTQTGGASLLNEVKNIFITFLSAKLVIEGEISLGMMLSISYIVGQLNSPVSQLVGFLQELQLAKLSTKRINEIHHLDDEDTYCKPEMCYESGDIKLQNVNFRYPDLPAGSLTLKELSFTIPKNKITAIVGSSGSGKTTILKLLLKFYNVQTGDILIGEKSIFTISHFLWRKKCAAVLQEGYIFNDSIEKNIVLSGSETNYEQLEKALEIANVKSFISSLPLGIQTKIGQTGLSLSGGQKQRILIARAVYKDPEVILFDEATSALDARNERIIVQNLEKYFKGKTVIIIAHRLSTVKNADKIIVLEKGAVVEEGSHSSLICKRKSYYNLIRNQLELVS